MGFDVALLWALGAVVIAGLMDWKGLDWATDKIANRVRRKVLRGPLVFEPGNRLKPAKLDKLD